MYNKILPDNLKHDHHWTFWWNCFASLSDLWPKTFIGLKIISL